MEKEAREMARRKKLLLETLKDLRADDLGEFKWHLTVPPEGFPKISQSEVEDAKTWQIVDLMFQTYSINTLRVTKLILEEMKQNELAQKVSNSMTEPTGKDLDLKKSSASVEGQASNKDQMDHGGEHRLKPGVRKYFCELTLDTNTANRFLKLSDNNKKVTHVTEKQNYPDHPDRFDLWCPQLMCTTGLTGRCYWEVKWRGGVNVAVTYRGISRKGGRADCFFGYNDQSWSLICSDDGYYVCHNNNRTDLPLSSSSSSSSSGRVAVYVDCPAGSLTFYRVSSDSLIHLHTFNTTFTEPLYPGFGLWYPGSSASLC